MIYTLNPAIGNLEEAEKNNSTLQYTISEVEFDSLNPYCRLLKDSGIDMKTIYKQLKEKLTTGEWSWINVRGLMDYGVVEGIRTKLQHEDRESNNNREKEMAFLSETSIRIMDAIEWVELSLKGTDKECLDKAQDALDIRSKSDRDKNEKTIAWEFVYKKYQELVSENEKPKKTGAESILEYMKNHGLTVQDLSLALAMAQATKTGVMEVEGHLISEKEAIQPNAGQPSLN